MSRGGRLWVGTHLWAVTSSCSTVRFSWRWTSGLAACSRGWVRPSLWRRHGCECALRGRRLRRSCRRHRASGGLSRWKCGSASCYRACRRANRGRGFRRRSSCCTSVGRGDSRRRWRSPLGMWQSEGRNGTLSACRNGGAYSCRPFSQSYCWLG